MPFIERVRMLAEERARDNESLDFYGAARELGACADETEDIDVQLTARVMRSRNAI